VAACAATLPLCLHGVAQQPFELDLSFRTTISDQHVSDMLLLQDGKLFVTGQLRWPGEVTFRANARLLPDGQRDMTYTGAFGDKNIIPWQDGKFYVQSGGLVQRKLPDGMPDGSFMNLNSNPFFLTGVSGGSYHVFSDGRILLTGDPTLSDTVRGFIGTHRLVYFQNNGWLDTTRTHRKGNGTIWRVKAQVDGRILCGGSSTVYDNQAVGRVFRIHPEGDLDTTFQSATTWGNIFLFNFVPLADGRFYQCGHFGTALTGSDTLCFARFHADGSLDTTFQPPVFRSPGIPPPLVQPGVRGAMVLPDGRILVHGLFRTVNGQPRKGICLVDSTGQLLAGFEDAGVGMYTYQGFTYANVNAVALDSANNHLYLAGTYVGYDDGTTNDPLQRFVTRLHLGGISTAAAVREQAAAALQLYPNPVAPGQALHLVFTPPSGYTPNGPLRVVVQDVTGRPVRASALPGPAGLPIGIGMTTETWPPGLYTVELHGDGHRLASTKLIVGQ
jgi:uncharacterized delta-60 repeat protein